MRDLLALAGRDVRALLRGRAPLRLAVALLLAGALVAYLARSGAPASAVAAGLALVPSLAVFAGVSAASLLPADRAAGREAWLATTRATPAARRLAPAFAGMAAALLGALSCALVVGLALLAVGRAPRVRAWERLTVPGGPVSVAPAGKGGRPLLLETPTSAGTLVVDVHPRWRRWEEVEPRLSVRWHVGGREGTTSWIAGTPLRVDLEAGGTVALENESATADLVVRGARWLEGPRPWSLTLLLAGLLAGVVAAALVPLAVWLSRLVRGTAAIALVVVLGLASALAPALADLLPPRASPVQDLALEVVRVAARAVPDLSVLRAFADPAAGRALDPSALAPLGWVVVYAALVLLLVALPLPRRVLPEAPP